MKRLLPLLLLCACAGSLVDHDGASSLPAGVITPPTKACLDTCKQPPPDSPQNSAPECKVDVCTYSCPDGLLRTALTTPPSCSVPSDVAAGGDHTCAIAVPPGGQGVIVCWGDNGLKQLGFDSPAASDMPLQVPGLPPAADLITASITQTCAHFANGEVWCWGGRDEATRPPHKIAGILGSTVNAIAAGAAHACAATDLGVFCWGHNDRGQLGSPPPPPGQPDVAQPTTQVSGVPAAKALAAGDNHTCAGDATGSQLWCWGDNGAGQNGTGTLSASSAPAVVQRAGATVVAAGANHTCSIGNGALSCWGGNSSFQIDNSGIDAPQPKGESVAQPVMGVAGGQGHTCAIENSGISVACWGLNDRNQLGPTGDTVSKKNPFRIPALSGVEKITAGSKHTCALKVGTILCWGANEAGQLGNGSVAGASATPALVTGL
jgi:alpha-tubulin suppressor-like RCC1 family protein